MGRYDSLYQTTTPQIPAPQKQDREIMAPPPQPKAVQPRTERIDRTDEPNERTAGTTLLNEISEGAPDDTRPTERYSFEIYTDLKPKIEELQYWFKKRTGKKLSSSRLIREAIEAYLPKAMGLLNDRKMGEGE
jgi:hypothetical protein